MVSKGKFTCIFCYLHLFEYFIGSAIMAMYMNIYTHVSMCVCVCVPMCTLYQYVYMLPKCLHYSCTLCECTMHITCIILHNRSNAPPKIVYSMFFWPKYLTLYTLKAYTIKYLF